MFFLPYNNTFFKVRFCFFAENLLLCWMNWFINISALASLLAFVHHSDQVRVRKSVWILIIPFLFMSHSYYIMFLWVTICFFHNSRWAMTCDVTCLDLAFQLNKLQYLRVTSCFYTCSIRLLCTIHSCNIQ